MWTRERRGVGGSREGGVGEMKQGEKRESRRAETKGGSRERRESEEAALSRCACFTVKHRYTHQHTFSDHFPTGNQ